MRAGGAAPGGDQRLHTNPPFCSTIPAPVCCLPSAGARARCGPGQWVVLLLSHGSSKPMGGSNKQWACSFLDIRTYFCLHFTRQNSGMCHSELREGWQLYLSSPQGKNSLLFLGPRQQGDNGCWGAQVSNRHHTKLVQTHPGIPLCHSL